MISSTVSWFDAVEIEHVTGLFLLGRFQPTQVLWLSVGQTIGVGSLIVTASRGLLARRPEIDEFCHFTPRYGPATAKFPVQIFGLGYLMAANCARSRANVGRSQVVRNWNHVA